MAVYLTRSFDRFLRKERIDNEALCAAAADVAAGRGGANPGGGV